MADQKPEETFKVVDRRLFTETGELRKDAVEQERREQEAAQNAAKNVPATRPAGNNSQGQPSPKVPAAAPAPVADEAAAEEEIPASRPFQMLVDFLTRNAAAMLGGVADPRTGQAFLDLEGAREMIDMLDVLREKTHGNLAAQDADLLIEVIGSLKLTYMEVSKAASEAMAKKAKQKG